ncbi:MAG TPA: response regulator [Anaeromyxobacter sp.]|nr:response regulator [Anaeromyxobacter sp.]
MRKRAVHAGRVLVVDDEPGMRDLLSRVLGDAGHAVSAVESGEEALVLLAREKFDVLVVDKNLPGIDGLGVLRLVRAHQPALRAIMITAYPSEESDATARALGVVAYIVKPFGVLTMIDRVDDAIADGRRAGHAAGT